MSIKNFTYGVITVTDGLGNSLVFTFDGLFSLNVPGREITFADDRGSLPATPCPIRGKQQMMTASLNALVQTLSNAGSAVHADLAMGELGSGFIGANWQSTGGASDIYLGVHVDFTDGVTNFRLPNCKIRGNFTEAAEGNRVDYQIECPHAYPTIS